jgi:hypothetical protein
MDETTVCITLDDTSITAAQLAGWVREVAPDEYTLAEALYIARCMIRGERWQPPYGIVAYGLKHLPSQPWSYTITTPPNPYIEQARLWKEQRALLEKAAAGDADAAIAYCKMELNGEINHGAMG